MLLYKDGRFAKDIGFRYYVLNKLQMQTASSITKVFVNQEKKKMEKYQQGDVLIRKLESPITEEKEDYNGNIVSLKDRNTRWNQKKRTVEPPGNIKAIHVYEGKRKLRIVIPDNPTETINYTTEY